MKPPTSAPIRPLPSVTARAPPEAKIAPAAATAPIDAKLPRRALLPASNEFLRAIDRSWNFQIVLEFLDLLIFVTELLDDRVFAREQTDPSALESGRKQFVGGGF